MTFRAVMVALSSLAIGAVSASARRPDASAAITAEFTRIEKRTATLGDRAETIADGLAHVKDSVTKGRLYFALDELQEPWTFEAASTWAAAHDAIKTSDQFSAEWKRIGEPSVGAASTALPAAVEAIAASNAIRAPATWRASLPYSEDAGMNAGLYYLGEAQAYFGFAAFCRSLSFDAHGTPVTFRPMGDQIGSLEAEIAALYDKAPLETRPRFIRVSVALKIARTLDEHKDYGAALYQYLDAKYRAAVAIARDAPPADVKGRLANARAHLAPGQDHSIAELFLQRAAYLLELNAPSAARSASVIADTVLPEYLKLVQR
jgi:hypothetical protein